VVQETEYTGAGKHPWAQLDFAAENGIDIKYGDPQDEIPGENIVIPEHPRQIRASEVPLENMRRSYLRNAVASLPGKTATELELDYLASETRAGHQFVEKFLAEAGIKIVR
jgi:hypothetical protein